MIIGTKKKKKTVLYRCMSFSSNVHLLCDFKWTLTQSNHNKNKKWRVISSAPSDFLLFPIPSCTGCISLGSSTRSATHLPVWSPVSVHLCVWTRILIQQQPKRLNNVSRTRGVYRAMISPELNFNLFSSDLSLYLKNQVKVELFGSGVGLSLVLGFSAAYACYYLISVAKVRWLYIGVGTVHIHLQMTGVIRMLVHVIGSYLQRCIFAAVDRVSARELPANDVIMQWAVTS